MKKIVFLDDFELQRFELSNIVEIKDVPDYINLLIIFNIRFFLFSFFLIYDMKIMYW